MRPLDDPWALPSCSEFLDEVATKVATGFAVVVESPVMPSGFADALSRHLATTNLTLHRIDASARLGARDAIAEALEREASVEAIAADASFLEDVLMVRLSGLDDAARRDWLACARRFREARDASAVGPGLIILDDAAPALAAAHVVCWGNRLRRLDVTIWVDAHVPNRRIEPQTSLAVALAVELCAWRLDLARELATARLDDLLDPLAWLERRVEAPVGAEARFEDVPWPCPLVLLERGDREALSRRIWKAQLIALFPWMEERRLALVDKHKIKLVVDDHARDAGLVSVDELEFDALLHQLRRRLGAHELDVLCAFRDTRNELAHRRPAPRPILDVVLKRHRALE